MNTEKPYTIIYSNNFYFEGVRLAFRKKELFNIDSTPIHIPFLNTHWNVKRKQLTLKKAKELIKQQPITIDVSDLQWYHQEQLNHVFNL